MYLIYTATSLMYKRSRDSKLSLYFHEIHGYIILHVSYFYLIIFYFSLETTSWKVFRESSLF